MTISLNGVRATAKTLLPGRDVVVADGAGLQRCAGVIMDTLSQAQAPKPCLEWARPGDASGQRAVLAELAFAACNFCYWSGQAHNYPAGGGATLMEDIVTMGLRRVRLSALWPEVKAESISAIITEMKAREAAGKGFPLTAERISNLQEIASVPDDVLLVHIEQLLAGRQIETRLDQLLVLLPKSFRTDIFVSRAILFFLRLNRELGLFRKSDLGKLPLPTDHQTARILHAYGATVYSESLLGLIARGEAIPAGSSMEMEIRAGSLLAGERLAKITGLTTSDIALSLRNARAQVTSSPHLTVTTAY